MTEKEIFKSKLSNLENVDLRYKDSGKLRYFRLLHRFIIFSVIIICSLFFQFLFEYLSIESLNRQVHQSNINLATRVNNHIDENYYQELQASGRLSQHSNAELSSYFQNLTQFNSSILIQLLNPNHEVVLLAVGQDWRQDRGALTIVFSNRLQIPNTSLPTQVDGVAHSIIPVTLLAIPDQSFGYIEIYRDISVQIAGIEKTATVFTIAIAVVMVIFSLLLELMFLPTTKLMRKYLKQKDQLLTAIDTMPQGIVLAQGSINNNPILFMNKSAERLLSDKHGLVENRHFDQVIPSEAEVFSADQITGSQIIYNWAVEHSNETQWRELILGTGSFVGLTESKDELLVGIINDITHKKKAEIRHEQLAASVENSSDAVEIFDAYGRYIYVNKAFERMMGYTLSEVKGLSPAEVFADSAEEVDTFDTVWHQIASGETWRGTFRSLSKSKQNIELDVSVFPIFNEQRNLESIVTIKRNITKSISERNRIAKLSVAVEQSSSMVMITDATGVIEYVNQSFLQTTGFSEKQVLGATPNILHSDKTPSKTIRQMWAALNEGKLWRGELLNLRSDKSEYWEQQTISPIRDEKGKTTHFVAIKEDITERKKAEQLLAFNAIHDDLTGLYNRSSFQQQLIARIETAKRNKDSGALMLVDIDGFKEINETLGHQGGDSVLKQIAKRLLNVRRDSDIIARLSGDEFVVFAPGFTNQNDVANVAERILQEINKPVYVDAQSIELSASIGIAMAPVDGEEVDLLLRHADLALYKSKDHGLGSYNFYRTEMDEEVQQFKLLASSMRRALIHNEFELYYQPVVSLGVAKSVEALIRWNNPDKGLVSPADFIPVAEKTRMIVPLGLWVIEQACLQIKAWLDQDLEIGVAVNLSPVQFLDGNLDQHVERLVKQCDIPPHLLHLEITEGMAIENRDEVIRVLSKLQKLGMEILLDDFGTGYSSLSQLRKLPIDRLKIDKSFLHDIRPEFIDVSVIKAILQLGDSLGMAVTVEGVETDFQEKILLELGCTDFQGYLFAKPSPASMVTSYLIGNKSVINSLHPKNTVE